MDPHASLTQYEKLRHDDDSYLRIGMTFYYGYPDHGRGPLGNIAFEGRLELIKKNMNETYMVHPRPGPFCDWERHVMTIDAQTGVLRRTMLMGAAEGGHVELTDFLLKDGANPHLKDYHGRTALYFAAQGHNRTVFRTLLEISEPEALTAEINGNVRCTDSPLFHLCVRNTADFLQLALETFPLVNVSVTFNNQTLDQFTACTKSCKQVLVEFRLLQQRWAPLRREWIRACSQTSHLSKCTPAL
jgi:hypothetical protein